MTSSCQTFHDLLMLCFSKGEVYQALLVRAKGSPLVVLVSGVDPSGTTTVVLLPPCAVAVTVYNALRGDFASPPYLCHK